MNSDSGSNRKEVREDQLKRKREDPHNSSTSNRRTFQEVQETSQRFFFREDELSATFKDRFTDRDQEFVDYVKNKPVGPPPVIDNWNHSQPLNQSRH